MQSPPKPQFTTWLIQQVETGQYAGLHYVEANKFRVPWKHNSRKDCNDEDSKIFRAWAVASGKINDFPNDKAKWKTNFRCALNNLRKHFRMIKDNSKNTEDPHKIYEIINTEYNYENQPVENSAEEFMTPDIHSSPIECFTSGTEHILFDKFMTLDLADQQVDQQWGENYAQHNPTVPTCYPAIASSTTEPLPVSQNHTPIPAQLPYYQQNPEPVLNSSLQPSIQDLEVSIHYRGKEMLKMPVSCSRLQFHYQHEAPELNAHMLCFPTTETLLDRKQIEYTNRILSSIQRGLLLEVRETGIYACRQDRCHVFSSISDPSAAHPDPRKLPQSAMVELLCFENFINELKHFREHNGVSPNYTIHMCFGEKFPDGKPLEKKLIVVKVVPLICRYFHEIAQMEGASSLHSANVSLQISNDNLYDLISSVFSLQTADEPLSAVQLLA